MTTTEQHRELPPRRWFVLAPLLSVVGFAAVSRAVTALSPEPTTSLPEAKLERFARNPGDVVFVGSSRVLRHLSPDAFDTAMAARGRRVRSFNLAAPLMMTLEQEHLLSELFERHPTGIRCVVVDPEHVELVSAERLVGTRRAEQWHTLAATLRSTRGLLASDAGPRATLAALYPHWSAFARRTAAYGALQRRFTEGVVERPPPFRPEELGAQGRGYMSLEDALASADGAYRAQLERRRKRFLEGRATWSARVAEVAAAISYEGSTGDSTGDSTGGSSGGPAPRLEIEAVLRMQALVRAHGAVPVFLINPGHGSESRNYLRRLARDGRIDVLVDLAHPEEYPVFYSPDNLFDENHLDEETAVVLTRTLADLLCRRMDEGSMREL